MRELVVHIAERADWLRARSRGEYAPPGLGRDGFVHLSRPEHAHLPANALYAGRDDLVLLWIDPQRLRVELRYEPGEPGCAIEFPHLYGPLNLDAVVGETALEPWETGGFALPEPPLA